MEQKKTTDARRRANKKYNETHTKAISLTLNLGTDADIIARLESVDNKQGYIKRLIRADIAEDAADGLG